MIEFDLYDPERPYEKFSWISEGGGPSFQRSNFCPYTFLMINPDVARIERAKEERRKQLINWEEYDRTYQYNHQTKSRKRGSKNVKFEADVVFLEAAARGDVDEGKICVFLLLFYVVATFALLH